jgi:hypothetical protein
MDRDRDYFDDLDRCDLDDDADWAAWIAIVAEIRALEEK